jgi:cyclomaltodextrinase / maltogenic alpha-amylase / neopullulanase
MKLGIYKHYKGNLYEVIGIARHSETLEELVVYKALYESKDFGKDALWVRPLKMFEEDILIDGKKVKRFSFVKQ